MRALLVSSLCLALWLGAAFSVHAQPQARAGAADADRPGAGAIQKRYLPEPDSLCQDPGSVQRDEEGATLAPEEPPISWREWRVGGPLPRAERAKLQAFLASEMARRQSLTRESRCELQAFVQNRLGYRLAGITVRSMEGGGTLAELEIEPLTLVRHIDVEVEDQAPLIDLVRLEWRELLSTLFETDILRRMRLRPGAPLASTPGACLIQLKREEERIRSYLQREGYPEAMVRILGEERRDPCKAVADRAHGPVRLPVRLLVHVRKNQPYRIGHIQIDGAQAVPESTIRSKFRRGRYCAPDWAPYVGGRCMIERFSQEELNEALQRVVDVYQERGYPAVRVRTDLDFRHSDDFDPESQTVRFTVIVNERRLIEVFFEGTDPDRFPQDRLRTLLTFENEGSYDEVEVAASAEAIRRHLQSLGYFEAQVTFERVDLGDFDRIVFTIHAGPGLSVANVGFSGVQAIPGRDLRAAVVTRPGFPLTDVTLSGDIERITQLYRQRGCRDAKVEVLVSRALPAIDNAAVLAALISSNASLVPSGERDELAGTLPASDPRGLYVRFSIEEGPQTQVERVTFEFDGPHRYGKEQLEDLLGFRRGDPYVREHMDRGRERIGRFYFENAYPRAEVRRCIRSTSPAPAAPTPAAPTPAPAAPTPAPATRGVEVVYQVIEQAQVSFGKVLVHGNFKTRDWVILSELNYREGKPLTLRAAEEGQQNLRASGLFNAVQVRFVNLEDGTEPKVNVVVDVQERHDYWVGMEGALVYSRDNGMLLESALRSPNVFGQGLQLGVRAQGEIHVLDMETRLLEGSFIVPHWLTRRLTSPLLSLFSGSEIQAAPRLETAVFWRRDDTERFGELTSYGFNTTLSAVGRRGFWQGWVLSLRYDLRRRDLEENLVRTPGSNDDLERDTVAVRTGALGPQLVIDKRRDATGRPNPLTPEGGFKLELRALYASPYLGSQSEFVKLGGGGQVFWSLTPRILLSSGLRYDHGIPIGASLLPETERFFAGGDTTVRGYEEDRLATEIIEEPVPPLGQVRRIRVLPAGGNIRFIHNLDLQFRLWELLEVPVASAVFLDSGMVTNSLEAVELTDLRHALGVALLRLVAPFGSLSVEYAVPLAPQTATEPRGRYHVNFGLLF